MSSFTSKSDSISNRSHGTLEREGISSLTNSLTQLSFDSPPEIPIFQFLPMHLWDALGEGWVQISSQGSGTLSRRSLAPNLPSGLIFQSEQYKTFSCLYLDPNFFSSSSSSNNIDDNSFYNLEFTLNLVKISSKTSNYFFDLIFNLKSESRYCLLRYNYFRRSWSLIYYKNPQEFFLLGDSLKSPLKLNTNIRILLQIRGSTMSLDVNGSPVFTKLIMPSNFGAGYGGLLGLSCSESKLFVKDWKIRTMKETAMINSISHKNDLPPPIQAQQSQELNSLHQQYQQISQQNQVKSKLLNEMYQKQTNSKSVVPAQSMSQQFYQQSILQPQQQYSSQQQQQQTAQFQGQQSLSQYLSQDTALKKVQTPQESLSDPKQASFSSNSSVVSNCSSFSNGILSRSGSIPYSEVSLYNTIAQNTIDNASTYSLPIANSNVSQKHSLPNSSQNTLPNTNEKLIPIEIQQQLQSLYDPSILQSVLATLSDSKTNNSVTFDNIAGLENSKRILNEAITLPLLMPEFFDGVCEPWKGILLFGPPGTGKTMLVKAICNSGGYKFFNTSASTLISKYRGDTEKIIKCLFHAATLCAPSIIFVDEIDSLLNDRSSNGEHEASRRMKTEFFIHLDGLNSNKDKKRVILIGATNCPWDLDPAILRRLEKRIYIPLPDFRSRHELLSILISQLPVASSRNDIIDMEELVELTQNYSGADIAIVIREASMIPMRRLLSFMSPHEMAELKKKGDLSVPKVTMNDLRQAISNTKPSVSLKTLSQFESWENEFSNV